MFIHVCEDHRERFKISKVSDAMNAVRNHFQMNFDRRSFMDVITL